MKYTQHQVQRILVWGQVVFWLSYFLFFLLYEKSFMTWRVAFFQSAKFFLVNITLVYVHMYVILPLLLRYRWYLRYALSVITLVALMVYTELSAERLFYTNPARIRYINATPHLIYLIGMDMIVMMISSPIKFALDFFRLQAQQQETTNQQLRAEMKYLKLQINPHFLFNTLNSLYYLTQNKSDLAPEVVQKLAQLMRYLLEKGNEEQVLLNQEIEFVEAYLELEKIRIAQCEIKFEKNGNVQNKWIPPMLLIPLVENAFKHGIDKSSADNYVFLYLEAADHTFRLEIRNRYLPNRSTASSGIGLENLQKRLKLLYNTDYELNTNIKEDTFVAFLKIPLTST